MTLHSLFQKYDLQHTCLSCSLTCSLVALWVSLPAGQSGSGSFSKNLRIPKPSMDVGTLAHGSWGVHAAQLVCGGSGTPCELFPCAAYTSFWKSNASQYPLQKWSREWDVHFLSWVLTGINQVSEQQNNTKQIWMMKVLKPFLLWSVHPDIAWKCIRLC